MEISHAIRHKGKIALLLFAVIFLEMFCSKTYNTCISEIGDSMNEVYTDRIVAQDYIYKMLNILHKRDLTSSHSTSDSLKTNLIFNDYGLRMILLLAKYEQTKLTPDEKIILNDFKSKILVMIALEKQMKRSNSIINERLHKSEDKLLAEALKQLDKLSQIQVSRVEDLNETSQRTVSFSSLLNQVDWALLIIIGITIQMLVFSAKSSRPEQPQNHLLN